MSPIEAMTQLRSADAASNFAAEAARCVDETVDDADSPDEVVGEVEDVVFDVVDDEFARLTSCKVAAAAADCDEGVEDAVEVVEGDVTDSVVVESSARLGSVEERRTSPPPSPPSLWVTAWAPSLWLSAWWATWVAESIEERGASMMLAIPEGSSLGRDRASATTFALPCT